MSGNSSVTVRMQFDAATGKFEVLDPAPEVKPGGIVSFQFVNSNFEPTSPGWDTVIVFKSKPEGDKRKSPFKHGEKGVLGPVTYLEGSGGIMPLYSYTVDTGLMRVGEKVAVFEYTVMIVDSEGHTIPEIDPRIIIVP